jgi:predicted amidophosphoribosyltransferase
MTRYDAICMHCHAPLRSTDTICPYCRQSVRHITPDAPREQCPGCNERAVVRTNGCKICLSCGWSACS